MALVIGDLQTVRWDAALKESMEKQQECDQPCHPQGLLLLPELATDFQDVAPSAMLSSCCTLCSGASSPSVTTNTMPRLSQCLSPQYLVPASSPSRHLWSWQKEKLLKTMCGQSIQGWALAEEGIALALSMEHFADQGTILSGVVPRWWTESSQASHPCTRAMCAFNIGKNPGSWDGTVDRCAPCLVSSRSSSLPIAPPPAGRGRNTSLCRTGLLLGE